MRRLALVLGLCGVTANLAADRAPQVDPQSGLLRWQLREGAFSLELLQQLPDQIRAFFQGRGFPARSADEFARACVFQAIVSNVAESGPAPVVIPNLRQWRIEAREGSVPLPLEPTWQAQWEAAGLPQTARVAFRWALLPIEQIFKPGDQGWGMIPFGVAPGTDFELALTWDEDGVARRARLALQCAPER